MEKRGCGMLLPVASLPSKYGIGAFSKEAYEFVDKLVKAGQQYWQILPLGPTGYGDSPYQAFGAFAGNPYFIDLEQLIEAGLLTEEECQMADFGSDDRDIDYGKIYENRFPLLKKAFLRWEEQQKKAGLDEKEIRKYLKKQLRAETRDYCFYMALKNQFGGKSFSEWDKDIRTREDDALKHYKKELREEIAFYEFQQMIFEKQWKALKTYANERGIRIIGDIPIYVASDSADSWAHPELFQFDEDCRPTAVAGCPPDAFSATGQLWGNPLYRWDYHKKTGYSWWMDRMEYSFELYDVVRVDHFRGFDAYYSIPAGSKTAEFGHWEDGPGYDLFKKMKERFGTLDIIAEDLGFLTPSVFKLVEKTGFPGMKVLEFAFDSRDSGCANDYLPHNYPVNSVAYTGTHDNETIVGWWSSITKEEQKLARDYMCDQYTPERELYKSLISLIMRSSAKLCVIPMQDYLGLGNNCRINTPSTVGKNWKWRVNTRQLSLKLQKEIQEMTLRYGRMNWETVE